MIGLIVKLVLFGVIVYLVYNTYRKVRNMLSGGLSGGAVPFARAEACPSCGAVIRVAAEPGPCPKCGTSLGRNPEGKLLIKVNE